MTNAFYEVRNQLSFNYLYYDIVFMCGPVAPDSIYVFDVYCDHDPARE